MMHGVSCCTSKCDIWDFSCLFQCIYHHVSLVLSVDVMHGVTYTSKV